MLVVNCLLNDTSIAQDIKDAIEILVAERLDAGRGVSFPAVYRDLRRMGLEVDAESAGALYNELYQGYSDPMLSNEQEIEEYAGRDVADQQDRMTDALINGVGSKQVQIGNLKPEKQISNMLARLFTDREFGTTKKVNSVMKEMENLVMKAAKSLIPPAKQKQVKNINEALDSFFGTEAVKFKTLSGAVNTLEDLHEAAKVHVRDYLDKATDSLSDDEAQDLIERWEKYTENFVQSAYDIMLSRSENTKLLNTALQQVQIEGVNVADINGNIKWSALMDDGDPKKIVDGVKKLFQEGIKDPQGNEHKYTAAQAERIGNYFQKLYDKKLASVQQAKIANARTKNISAKNIISDFIKDRGFINLVKDPEGKLLLTQANWDAALKHMNIRVGKKDGLDEAAKQLQIFLNDVTRADGTKLTDKQKQLIEQEFRKSVAARLMPNTGRPGALERLAALQNLNRGKAFEESTSYALNQVLGVSGLNQSTINKISQLTKLFQNIVAPNNVTGSTSTNPAVNRGAYAFQALSQVERKIKEIIRESRISTDKKQAQRVAKYLGDLMTSASTTLLINPGNFSENIITGFASNLAETVNMAATNPALLSQLGPAQKAFLTAMASHISGGVANEVIVEDDVPLTELPAGERLRLRALREETKKGVAGIAGAVAKSPSYVANIASRSLMNSWDAGFNSAILRKQVVQAMYRALKAEGLTGDEALKAMDKALNVDDTTQKELVKENNRIMQLLKDAGLHPTYFDSQQNLLDMRLSLYEDALNAGVKKTGTTLTPRQIRESTKAMIDGAQKATKVLTGKKQIPSGNFDWINKLIYLISSAPLALQRQLYKSQTESEKEGRLASAAAAQGGAELWKNSIARFVGGIANFAALATTATPAGLMFTVPSLAMERAKLKRANENAAVPSKADPGVYRKYAELNNLIRSMAMRSALGTALIGGFVLRKMMKDDDEDDDIISNLMQTKSGRRLLAKFLPMGMNIAAAAMYDIRDPKLDNRWERLAEVLSNITGTTYDKWSGVKTSISRAKDDGQVVKAIVSGASGYVPTYNINQVEQMDKFITTLKSAVDQDYISEVQRDEAISKAIYKSAEDWIDVMMINGAIDAIRRATDQYREGEDIPFNRYNYED